MAKLRTLGPLTLSLTMESLQDHQHESAEFSVKKQEQIFSNSTK